MKNIFMCIILLVCTTANAQIFTDTKGTINISEFGTANYTVPVALPPSIKNVAPEINLVYSSGLQGGIAGQGWNISGISNISRIATRTDIDGFIDGVDFDANDKLALDGQRLLLKTGTYWGNGSTYYTEYKSNLRIELKISGTTTYFVVTQVDGSRNWYGSFETGAMQNAMSPNAWFIVRHEDAHGNAIVYNYEDVVYAGMTQKYISNIVFSGNDLQGIAFANQINFKYAAPSRIVKDYTNGTIVYSSKLLDYIEVKTGGELFRKYDLIQEPTDLGYDRLTQIQEINGDGEGANPIVFTYENTVSEMNVVEKDYATSLDFDQTSLTGDFDGDGRLDFIAKNQLFTHLFNGSPNSSPIALPFYATPHQMFAATTLENGKLSDVQSMVYVQENDLTASFNFYKKSATSDAISLNRSVSVPRSSGLTYNPLFNFTSREEVFYSDTLPEVSPCTVPEPRKANEYLEGDFNGDGISEALMYVNTQEHFYYELKNVIAVNILGQSVDLGNHCITHYFPVEQQCFLVNFDPRISQADFPTKGFISMGLNSPLYGDKKVVGDFNSDGKSDILVLKNDGAYKVVGFKQLDAAPWVEAEIIGQGWISEYSSTKQMLLGDYNGDGKTDLMLPDTEGDKDHSWWHVYYSDPKQSGGEMFIEEGHNIVEYWPDTKGFYNQQRHFSNYYSVDINKDGKSDIIRVWRSYYKPGWTINDHDTAWEITGYVNAIGHTWVNNLGVTFPKLYDSDVWVGPPFNDYLHRNSGSPDIPIPVVSNYKLNGANNELVLVRGHYDKIEYYQFTKDAQKDNRLSTVSEAAGNITHTIAYQPMVKTSDSVETSFYFTDGLANYPDLELVRNERNYLVSKLTTTVNGISKYQDFRYFGCYYNLNYGGLGFKRTTRSSWYVSPSDSKIWTTKENSMVLRGANTRIWTSTNGLNVFKPSLTDVLSKKTNTYSYYTDPATKVYNLRLTGQNSSDELTDVSVVDSYAYDGLVTNIAAYGIQVQHTAYYYSGSTLQGTFINAVGMIQNNPNGAGSAYYIGRPLKTTTESKIFQASGNDTRTSETLLTYDGANVSKIQKKGHNTDYIVEEMTYDGLGNLKTKTVSAPTAVPAVAARTITDEYDATKRFVTKKTDHQGFVTQLEYNSAGQLKKSTDYRNVINDFSYDKWGKLTESKISNIATTQLKTTTTYAKVTGGGYVVTNTNSPGDNQVTKTYYNVLGQVVKTSKRGFTTLVNQEIEYDIYGRKFRESLPYTGSAASKWTIYGYDNLDRVKQITAPTGRQAVISYAGLTTTTVDDGITKTTTVDAMGNKVQSTDAGGSISYSYYATGQLKETLYGDHKITIGIDGWGNKTATLDPNAGAVPYTYAYDAFGQLTHETTPKGYTHYDYDNVGKLIHKKISGDGADYEINYAYNDFGQLLTETSTIPTSNIDYSYSYDNYHRLEVTTENNANLEHTKTLTYDTLGRVSSETAYTREKSASDFNATVVSKFVYSNYNGKLYKITDQNNIMLWQLNSENANGQMLTSAYGNGVSMAHAYNANFYMKTQQHFKGAVSILNNEYTFDDPKGNLMSRSNYVLGINETFTYDKDRLATWTNPVTGLAESNSYDLKGRITENSKLGTFNYKTDPAEGIYKKENIRLNADGKAYYSALAGNQTVTYTMFKAPISINESNKGMIDFAYNSHLSRSVMNYDYGTIPPSTTKALQRKKKLYTDNGLSEVIYDYAANTVKIRTFVGGDAYGAVLYVEKSKDLTSGTITEAKYYLHRDYLGSILAITDETGTAVEKRHFDAWGNLSKIVNAGNVALDVANGLQVFDRGYTSHEHLHEVRLINMNGRLYDPMLKSFLMPDNYVQDPGNTQNYNRFAYVLNNPLKYTDPSGEEFVAAAIGIVVSVAVALTSYTLNALLADVPFSANGMVHSAGLSVMSSVATFGIGTAALGLFTNYISQAAFQAAAHGLIQGAMTSANGGKFWSGFAAGAVSSIVASAWGYDSNGAAKGLGWGDSVRGSDVGMVAFSTVSGGASAELTGGNFWQGAISGLTVSLLNHTAHKIVVMKLIDDAIIKAGFNPEDVARWTNEELTMNIAKIFPELYESANCPSFEIQDIIGGKDNVYGQAQAVRSGEEGSYKIVSKGLIYIKKLALNTIRQAASVAGHELNHMADYVDGTYAGWLNTYGLVKGKAYSEVKAYGWQKSMGAPYDDNMYNHYLNLINQ